MKIRTLWLPATLAAMVVALVVPALAEREEKEGAEAEERTEMADDGVGAAKAPGAADAKAVSFKADTTLNNLIAAFNGESNASAKYLVYAGAAKTEGYPAVEALFTAASKAEGIHAANHAEVIKRLGGVPKADVQAAASKGTAENLKDALAGENFERTTMYPAYLKVARADRRADAIRTFNYATIAEEGHAKLYKEAGEKLVQMKDKSGAIYYVCPTCGYTVTGEEYATFSKCPVCFTGGSTFIEVK